MLNKEELKYHKERVKNGKHSLSIRSSAMVLCLDLLEREAMKFGIWLKMEKSEFSYFKKDYTAFPSKDFKEYSFGTGTYYHHSCYEGPKYKGSYNAKTNTFNTDIRYIRLINDLEKIRNNSSPKSKF